MATTSTCTVAGCERPLLARGWCSTHYMRWRRTGTIADPASVCLDRRDAYNARRRERRRLKKVAA